MSRQSIAGWVHDWWVTIKVTSPLTARGRRWRREVAEVAQDFDDPTKRVEAARPADPVQAERDRITRAVQLQIIEHGTSGLYYTDGGYRLAVNKTMGIVNDGHWEWFEDLKTAGPA